MLLTFCETTIHVLQPMIVIGPLSMSLMSEISHELSNSNGETNGIGMRIVDVGEEAGQFTHKWTLLDDEDELYEHAMERRLRQAAVEDDGEDESQESSSSSLVVFGDVHLSTEEAMKWHSFCEECE